MQIHGSRESIVNIDVEGPSTSLGPFDILSPDNGREFDHNGVEVIRFQPAQIDYHDVPVSSSGHDHDEVDEASDGAQANHIAPSEELKRCSMDAGLRDGVISEESEAIAMASVHHDEEVSNKVVESSSLLCVPSPSMDSLNSDSTECELLVPRLTEQADKSHNDS